MVHRVVCLALTLALTACIEDDSATDAGGDAGDGGADSSPMEDAAPIDSGPAPIECGNGIIEAGESCDDGDDATGDGCAPDCSLEPYCGDGTVQAPELCDDGNQLHGDGCSAECASNESCGNGRIDVAAGERCDDGNTTPDDGCAADCASVDACGDAVLDPGEECDDGNVAYWDRCGADCRVEQNLVLSEVLIAGTETGCDLNADGVPDNLFGVSWGGLLDIVNAQLAFSVDTAVLLLLLDLYDLDDLVEDDALSVGVAAAFDADTDRDNNFSGMAALLADEDSLRPDGLPHALLTGSLAGGMLETNLGDFGFRFVVSPEYPATLVVRNGTITGTVSGTGSTIERIDDGQLCGVLPIDGLQGYGNPLRGVVGFGDVRGCDGRELASFADVAVGGTSILGLSTPSVQPDVDVDGDGLERFEVFRDGPTGCQPVITACIDGDGTRYEDPTCAADPRFTDGISATFAFTAVRAIVDGRARAR